MTLVLFLTEFVKLKYDISIIKNMKYRLLLIKHGETDWNKEKKLQGITDIPLNENGKKHAELVAGKILEAKENPTAILSSPLMRAKQTAEIFSKMLKLQVTYNSDIQEVNFGTLEGLTWSEVKRVTGKDLEFIHENFQFDYTSYGGESIKQVLARMKNFEEFLNSKTESFIQTFIVISHGTFIKVFLKEKTGKYFDGGFVWPIIYFPIEI